MKQNHTAKVYESLNNFNDVNPFWKWFHQQLRNIPTLFRPSLDLLIPWPKTFVRRFMVGFWTFERVNSWASNEKKSNRFPKRLTECAINWGFCFSHQRERGQRSLNESKITHNFNLLSYVLFPFRFIYYFSCAFQR